MASLRTISSRRLIAGLGGIVVLGLAGVGIAAAVDGATPPPPQSLADALHQAATGAKPDGITADVTFTNNLLSSSGFMGTDPLMSGATGRLWASAAGDLRIELQTSGGGTDSQILVNSTSVTVYDGSQNTVYRMALPANASATALPTHSVPTVAEIQTKLDEVAKYLNISADAIPGSVANVPSYSTVVSPKTDPGLIGDAQLAWDAANGVPLQFSIYAKSDPSTPAIGVTVNDISYGPIDPSALNVTPPADAKVVVIPTPQQPATGTSSHPEVTGLAAVQAQLPFTVVAPDALNGQSQHQVRLIDTNGEKAAVVSYGTGPGGYLVLERAAGSGTSTPKVLSQFPSVHVAGVTGHELTTPLGTVVTFTKGGVEFVLAGSVTQADAEAAAGALS